MSHSGHADVDLTLHLPGSPQHHASVQQSDRVPTVLASPVKSGRDLTSSPAIFTEHLEPGSPVLQQSLPVRSEHSHQHSRSSSPIHSPTSSVSARPAIRPHFQYPSILRGRITTAPQIRPLGSSIDTSSAALSLHMSSRGDTGPSSDVEVLAFCSTCTVTRLYDSTRHDGTNLGSIEHLNGLPLASGRLLLYRLQSSGTSFISCGNFVHPVFPRSSWWKSDRFTLVTPKPRGGFYRFQMTCEEDGESRHICRFKRVLSALVTLSQVPYPFRSEDGYTSHSVHHDDDDQDSELVDDDYTYPFELVTPTDDSRSFSSQSSSTTGLAKRWLMKNGVWWPEGQTQPVSLLPREYYLHHATPSVYHRVASTSVISHPMSSTGPMRSWASQLDADVLSNPGFILPSSLNLRLRDPPNISPARHSGMNSEVSYQGNCQDGSPLSPCPLDILPSPTKPTQISVVSSHTISHRRLSDSSSSTPGSAPSTFSPTESATTPLSTCSDVSIGNLRLVAISDSALNIASSSSFLNPGIDKHIERSGSPVHTTTISLNEKDLGLSNELQSRTEEYVQVGDQDLMNEVDSDDDFLISSYHTAPSTPPLPSSGITEILGSRVESNCEADAPRSFLRRTAYALFAPPVQVFNLMVWVARQLVEGVDYEDIVVPEDADLGYSPSTLYRQSGRTSKMNRKASFVPGDWPESSCSSNSDSGTTTISGDSGPLHDVGLYTSLDRSRLLLDRDGDGKAAPPLSPVEKVDLWVVGQE